MENTSKKTLKKKARWESLHFFILRCRSALVMSPIKTREGYRITDRVSKAFLAARIHQSYVVKIIVNTTAYLKLSLQNWCTGRQRNAI